jgi:sugar phosphate isomerase/epimerase
MERVVSISTAAFDGYDFHTAFEEIARLGVRTVEFAFIQGYTDPFSEDYFSDRNSRSLISLLKDYGLACFAFSAHLDLSRAGIVPIFKRRMDFATSLGSKIIITNAAPSDKKELFFESVDDLIHHAESLGLTIGLENPGDGSDNLVNSAKEGAILIRKIGSKFLKMNYDLGNLLSHLQGRIRPEDDFLEGLDAIVHLHIKDVQRSDLGWEFTAIGDGEIDYARVFEVLKDWHLLYPISLEVPLRISRNTNASPRRKKEPVPLATIRATLEQSVRFARIALA